MSYIFDEINRAKKAKWDEILLQFPNSNYFSTTNFAQSMQFAFDWNPIFVNHKDKAFFLFFLKDAKVFGVKFRNAFSYSQPNAKNEKLYYECLEKAIKYAKEKNSFSFSYHSENPAYYPTTKKEVIVNTAKKSEEIFSTLPKTLRKNIRKEEKLEIEIVDGTLDDMAQSYEFYKSHYKHLNIGTYPKKYFLSLCAEMKTCRVGKFFIAKKQGEFVSALLVSDFNKKLYEMHVSNNPKYLNLNVQDILKWHAIKYASDNNYKEFSLSEIDINAGDGSKTANINRYKLKFGKERAFYKNSIPISFFSKIIIPLKSVVSK